VFYFAYGSNLNRRQMHDRCPEATVMARAVLHDHLLIFGGFSRRWNGPVASITRAEGSAVPGLLYRIGKRDAKRLDLYEGCPHAYRRIVRPVWDARGRQRRALLYVQPAEDFEPLAPARKYFRVLERAYARLGFDMDSLIQAAGVGQ
jgi:gamma-glutamylcyclotransferase